VLVFVVILLQLLVNLATPVLSPMNQPPLHACRVDQVGFDCVIFSLVCGVLACSSITHIHAAATNIISVCRTGLLLLDLPG